jgi:hypothetical protein
MPLPSRKTVPDGISRRLIMNEERIGSIMETRDLSGFSVLDCDNRKIGTADEVWEDHTGQPAFLSVKTGWLGLGRSHFIPLYEAEVSPSSRAIRLPYDEETVKNSPDFESETDIDAGRESALFEYYRARGKGMPEQPARDWGPGSRSMEAEARPDEAASVELKEETLNVGKHEVESGGVRLRKRWTSPWNWPMRKSKSNGSAHPMRAVPGKRISRKTRYSSPCAGRWRTFPNRPA